MLYKKIRAVFLAVLVQSVFSMMGYLFSRYVGCNLWDWKWVCMPTLLQTNPIFIWTCTILVWVTFTVAFIIAFWPEEPRIEPKEGKVLSFEEAYNKFFSEKSAQELWALLKGHEEAAFKAADFFMAMGDEGTAYFFLDLGEAISSCQVTLVEENYQDDNSYDIYYILKKDRL